MKIINILFKDKRIKHCPICDKWFYDDSKFNKRKYCNNECSRKAHNIKRVEDRNKKHFVNPSPATPTYYTQKIKDYDNKYDETVDPTFNQDDRYWGLGGGNLTENPRRDFKKEQEYIRKEMKRLRLR